MDLFENKHQGYGLFYLKQVILLFWGIWFFIAFLTNVADFLMATGTMTASSFHSGNYSALEKVVNIYDTPHHFLNVLFSLDIFAQGLSAILFLTAAFCFWKRIYSWQIINIAFSISMSLWAIFLIMEEIFIAYSYETTHIGLFMFEMVSLLTLHLLPNNINIKIKK
jgi:hypothetical protein